MGKEKAIGETGDGAYFGHLPGERWEIRIILQVGYGEIRKIERWEMGDSLKTGLSPCGRWEIC